MDERICITPEYDPLHCDAGTRHAAVTVTDDGEDPHESPPGEVDRAITLGLLLRARSWTKPALGLQDTESTLLPEAKVAVKLMVKGLTAQVTLGCGVEDRTTEA